MTSNSFILTQSFHDEVFEVLRYCDMTFKLLGYELPVLTLTLQELPQDSPLKRLGQQSSELQRSTSVKGPITLLQITKIIVSLVANHSLTPSQEETFEDLIEMLQGVDPLERFLQLIADNDLYRLLIGILKTKDTAVEIFATRALDCALRLGDRRLVEILLDAEADPYECDLPYLFVWGWSKEGLHRDRDLAQKLLEAQLKRDRSAFKHRWEMFIRQDNETEDFRWESSVRQSHMIPNLKWFFTLILKSLVQFVRPTSREDCHMVIEAMIADNHQFFNDRSQSLRVGYKQDYTFSIVFECICKIALPKVATEALRLL